MHTTAEILSRRLHFVGPDRATMHLAGEVDIATGPTVVEAAEWIVGHEIATVELDLSCVEFIDVGGRRALDRLRTRLESAGVTVVVTATSRALMRLDVLANRGATAISEGGCDAPRF